MSLQGKAALVTGGGRGIGRRLALALAETGCNVAVAALEADELGRVKAELEGFGVRCQTVVADMTMPNDVRRMLLSTLDVFDKLDVFVANAGVTDKEHRPITELPHDVWNHVIDVNLTGTFNCLKEILPHLYTQGRGNVIVISSLLGQKGYGKAHDAPYCASKFGLEGLVEAACEEAAPYHVNINTLFPAAKINTGFFDYVSLKERSELESPDILVEPALFLARLEPGALTRQSINAWRWREEAGYREGLFEQAGPGETRISQDSSF